jgi:hypothetical protein
MASVTKDLEPKGWTERDAQVVVGSVVEVHFVADVESKADRTEMALQSATGVQHPVYIVCTQSAYGAKEGSQRGWRVVDSKIDEAALQRNEAVWHVVRYLSAAQTRRAGFANRFFLW